MSRALRGAADGLALAAAPTFAVMALLTGVSGPPEVLCAPGGGGLPLSGMVPMYLLMSAFHAAPWMRLIARRRGDADAAPRRLSVDPS